MKDAERILHLLEYHAKADRKEIVKRLDERVLKKLGKTRRDQYDMIQFITGKSIGFITTWIFTESRKVDIPLIDICKLSLAVNENVYAMLTDNLDDLCDAADADLYIRAFLAHKASEKSVVVDNLNKHYPLDKDRTKKIQEITNAKLYAVRSWFNRGFRARTPISALCQLAIHAEDDIDFFDLLV